MTAALVLFSLPCLNPAWATDADVAEIRRHDATPEGLAAANRRLEAIGRPAGRHGCVVLARRDATLDDLSGGWGDPPRVVRSPDDLP